MDNWKVEVFDWVNGVKTLVAFAEGLNKKGADWLHNYYYDEGHAMVHTFKV